MALAERWPRSAFRHIGNSRWGYRRHTRLGVAWLNFAPSHRDQAVCRLRRRMELLISAHSDIVGPHHRTSG